MWNWSDGGHVRWIVFHLNTRAPKFLNTELELIGFINRAHTREIYLTTDPDSPDWVRKKNIVQ